MPCGLGRLLTWGCGFSFCGTETSSGCSSSTMLKSASSNSGSMLGKPSEDLEKYL